MTFSFFGTKFRLKKASALGHGLDRRILGDENGLARRIGALIADIDKWIIRSLRKDRRRFTGVSKVNGTGVHRFEELRQWRSSAAHSSRPEKAGSNSRFVLGVPIYLVKFPSTFESWTFIVFSFDGTEPNESGGGCGAKRTRFGRDTKHAAIHSCAVGLCGADTPAMIRFSIRNAQRNPTGATRMSF